jgi:very-short-patch-repair endonuclease
MSKRLIPVARKMRRQPTDAEKRLWYHLRDRRLDGFKFHQQEPLAGYIVDFLCEEAGLIVEADGGQHGPQEDALRTRALEAAGYTVIRFWNNDILANTPGVLAEIRRTLGAARP